MRSLAQVLSRAALSGLFALISVGAHAQTERLVIVALGASNTAGWGVAAAESYPEQLKGLLAARGIAATIINAGVPGDTTGGMLARLEHEVPAGTRLVILQPGTNDERAGSGPQRAANIAEIGRRLAARGTKLVLIENSLLDALPRSELREDQLHFTPKGYALLAEQILPVVIEALGN
ncbi:MAG TPA: GDSL-type esterase/lipase family protein [Hyphomicrobiaceae bacterium]|nr:GDSL-type esterase/lipase family protein [Hyphomicrobiaceae bacterium]